MSIHLYDIIKSPLITEKGARQSGDNKYYFRVHPNASKHQVKDAVEKIFNVKVLDVNTLNVLGKWKRVRIQPGKTSDWKKAIVTLKEGQKIELT